ncbi:hypothetical protein JTB14_013732 [Gonioctena quinquepunctata]|nr:hypothetical protein JTB14_013732 [Gonioctena quinquepunctata]
MGWGNRTIPIEQANTTKECTSASKTGIGGITERTREIGSTEGSTDKLGLCSEIKENSSGIMLSGEKVPGTSTRGADLLVQSQMTFRERSSDLRLDNQNRDQATRRENRVLVSSGVSSALLQILRRMSQGPGDGCCKNLYEPPSGRGNMMTEPPVFRNYVQESVTSTLLVIRLQKHKMNISLFQKPWAVGGSV